MGAPDITLRLRLRGQKGPVLQRANDVCIVISCAVAGLLGCLFSYTFVGERLTLTIGLFSMLTPVVIGVLAAKRGGILDPVAVFTFAYAAYNGLILSRFAFLEPFDFPYPIGVNQSILFRASIMSSLGTIGLALGWLFGSRRRPYRLPRRSESQCAAAFTTGCAFYGVGIFFYLLQYQQLGGYTGALAIDRAERFAMMQQTISTPYVGFVIVGLVLMFYGGIYQSRKRTNWAIAALGFWVLAVGLQGDRRLILQILMAVGLVIGSIRPTFTKFRPLVLLVIMVGLFAALLFGQYRPFLTFFLSKGMTVSEIIELAKQHASPTFIMPENTEFGGPYVSILDLSHGKIEYSLGITYLSSIPAVIPRAIYPGKKTIAPSEDLANSLNKTSGAPVGWGYTPIAEAYLNFGMAGVLPIMCLWSLFFTWLSQIRWRGIIGVVTAATLVQQAVNVNRIDFRSVYLESFFSMFAAGAALLCISLFQKWKSSIDEDGVAISLESHS
jgi:oligosaccharide repeat unit polymerase